MKYISELTESALQQILFTWHWNSRPAERGRLWMQYNNPKNKAHGAILKGMGLVAVVSDLAYLREDGRMLFIELKLPGETQSKSQEKWQKTVEASGAEYVVIDNFEDFKKLFENG